MLLQMKAIIIATVLILAIIIVVPIGSSNEIDSGFGSWKVDCYAITEDGKEILLNPTNNGLSFLLSWYHEGVEVVSVDWRLKAKATGSGYDSVFIDMSDLRGDSYMCEYPYGMGWDWIGPQNNNCGTKTIPLDGQYHELANLHVDLPSSPGTSPGYKLELRWISYAYVFYQGIDNDGDNGPVEQEDMSINALIDMTDSGGGQTDADGDGVPDSTDNCPNTYNPGQEDADGDGIGDACDSSPGTNNPVVTITSLDFLIDPMQEPTEVKYRIEDVDNTPMSETVIQWGGDGSNTYYGESEGYIVTHTHSHVWSVPYVIANTGAMVTITCTDPVGLTGTASGSVLFTSGFQIVPYYSISTEGMNSHGTYHYGDKYLGN